jgi:hypothetical protein
MIKKYLCQFFNIYRTHRNLLKNYKILILNKIKIVKKYKINQS